WMTRAPDSVATRAVPAPNASAGRVTGAQRDGAIVMTAGGTEIRVDPATGRLARVTVDGRAVSLRDGPRPVAGTAALQSVDHPADGNDYVVDARYTGELQRVRWRLAPNGWLRLDVSARTPRD